MPFGVPSISANRTATAAPFRFLNNVWINCSESEIGDAACSGLEGRTPAAIFVGESGWRVSTGVGGVEGDGAGGAGRLGVRRSGARAGVDDRGGGAGGVSIVSGM